MILEQPFFFPKEIWKFEQVAMIKVVLLHICDITSAKAFSYAQAE